MQQLCACICFSAFVRSLGTDSGDTCELIHLRTQRSSCDVVVINQTAGGPYCYEVPNVSYAEDVISNDPLASLGGEASMHFNTTCPKFGYSNYLGYDPVFTSAKLFTQYPSAQDWQQALAEWYSDVNCTHGGPWPSQTDPLNYWWPVDPVESFVQCTSPFALCYFAKCMDLGNGNAKCGCYEGAGVNMVDVNCIIKPCNKVETISACPEGSVSCTANESPFCEYMQNPSLIYGDADLISDFNYSAGNSPEYIGTYDCTDPGRYANCMTAPCSREPFEMDGVTYNVTCDCPIRAGKYSMARSIPQEPCQLPPGFLWSAAPPQ